MEKKFYLIVIISSILILAACGNTSSASGDDVKVMRLANVVSEERSLSKGFYKFEEIVERESEGSIEVEIFTQSLLGGDRQIFEGMQLNTIQGSTMSTGPISQFANEFNIFDLPFLFNDKESAFHVLDGPIGDEILEALEDQNVVGLNYWENGYRQLTNSDKEVKSPEDVKGLNIRTLENDLHMNIWRSLGANPTPMNYGELYIGLEQGVVDGQENPVGNVVNDGFYEVQDYLTITNHVYNASPFMVSKPFWDSLTEEEQIIVADAAEEAKEYQREQNNQEDEDGYKFLEEQGMVITDISNDMRTEFREEVEPVYEQFRQQFGSELLDRIEAEVEAME